MTKQIVAWRRTVTENAIPVIFVVSAVLLIAQLGQLLFSNWGLYKSNRDLSAAMERQPDFDVADLNSGFGTTLAEAMGPDNVNAPRKLILIAGDGCRLCTAAIARMADLVQHIKGNGITFSLISYGREQDIYRPLIQAIRSRELRYDLRVVANPATFSLTTGITAMPTTILLDSEARLIASSIGINDSDTPDILSGIFDVQHPQWVTHDGRHFIRGRAELVPGLRPGMSSTLH